MPKISANTLSRKLKLAKVKAQKLISEYVLEPPIPVEQIARYIFNAHIKYYNDMPEELRGIVGITEDCVAIGINKRISCQKQRFALAHEIGHIEFGHINSLSCFRTDKTKINNKNRIEEKIANTFAEELLVPSDFLRQVHHYWSIEKIAAICLCDKEVVINRLKNLLLLP